MTPPVVHSLREQIREHILEGIVSGRWQPGERIVERRIAVELEVSQTPVREALRELESLQLIESAPNKGVRVRNLTADDLKESYPVRAGLEQVAAELAAGRLAEDTAALEREVTALRAADLAGKVRANKITPDELSGATFTISNTGSRGALFDTVIVPPNQVGILGIGATVKRPVVINHPDLGETIAVRDMTYLALSYDHRLVDGADAARYLTTVKQILEAAEFETEIGL